MTRRKLHISPKLTLPLDAVTETFAILAKRGAGKTYTASVLVEEMLAAQLQVVVIDPIGAWWGLRAGADGKPDGGYQVAVLGGDRGDIPLEATGGRLVADLVVDEQLSAVLDLSAFSKSDRRRFVADFLERLYQRNRDPLHVVLEEADLFAPEGKLKRAGDEAMLGAVYDLVRRGRARGLGSTLITQRSASISKEVLTQAEVLIALRTTGPHDRKAIEAWIEFHGTKEERDHVLGELPHLPTGTAFVWWPVEQILRKVAIRERRTYDSSATPKPGERRRAPKTLADVDLEALRSQMADTIEKAKAEDPKELRRQVADLKRELGKRPTETERVEVEVPVEVPVVRPQDIEQLERILAPAVNGISAVLQDAQVLLKEIRDRAGAAPAPRRAPAGAERKSPPTSRRREVVGGHRAGGGPVAPPARKPRRAQPEAADDIAPSQQRILDALSWFETLGLGAPKRAALAPMAGTKTTSGGFKNNLGALRTAGLLDYPAANRVELTDAGRERAEVPAVEPTAEALQEAVLASQPPSRAAILRALIDSYPDALDREELAERVGVPTTSGGFKNNLGALRTLELIDYPQGGYVVALPVLFLEGAAA